MTELVESLSLIVGCMVESTERRKQ